MNLQQNLFLVGLMGAGKTTVGRQLASITGKRFVDSDLEIEARLGVKIPVIFDLEGEAGFRDREAAMIAELTQESGIVLGTGGGSVLRPENRAHLASRGTVIYLHGLPDELHRRTRHDRNRPILRADDPLARLTSLYEFRDPLYREVADVVVDTGKQSVKVLVERLLAQLEESQTHPQQRQTLATA